MGCEENGLGVKRVVLGKGRGSISGEGSGRGSISGSGGGVNVGVGGIMKVSSIRISTMRIYHEARNVCLEASVSLELSYLHSLRDRQEG
ncbi:hypothetical protein L1987_20007 [Smallanthus sonchifolius]|uniref:Uncharacterized protein n=1 Tax=Smallanthus sonchifolius TaxID=185202 RepID=A0ACB9ISQ4_9ASTR|nr:hypothetical protein L1987_20007 [Smallanthus sonchifolius]